MYRTKNLLLIYCASASQTGRVVSFTCQLPTEGVGRQATEEIPLPAVLSFAFGGSTYGIGSVKYCGGRIYIEGGSDQNRVTLEKLKSAIFNAGNRIFQFSLETASAGAVKAST